jgi:hypothetical protein
MLDELAKLLFEARGWGALSSWDEHDDDHPDLQQCRKDARAVALRVLEEARARLERRELKDETILASAVHSELDRLAAELEGTDGDD